MGDSVANTRSPLRLVMAHCLLKELELTSGKALHMEAGITLRQELIRTNLLNASKNTSVEHEPAPSNTPENPGTCSEARSHPPIPCSTTLGQTLADAGKQCTAVEAGDWAEGGRSHEAVSACACKAEAR